MNAPIKAIRGMNDILPQESSIWRAVETLFMKQAAQYGFDEMRTPFLESTQLFKRSIGDVTDIVEKEMYTFTDLNGDSLTLRPEGTASCVRACIEHHLLRQSAQRLWYLGPMFRHEKPQKGRYRQFFQLGLEVFGIDGVAVELELISFCWRFWQALGIRSHVALQINSIGTLSDRQRYREALVAYLTPLASKLDEDSQKRLSRSPLRILDSKDHDTQQIVKDAPKLSDFLSKESQLHFEELMKGLTLLEIPFTVNQRLVRGLDYYNNSVFEWVTEALGSQATICAGGRFDGLFEQLGAAAAPAVGFAAGLERIVLLAQEIGAGFKPAPQCEVFIIVTEPNMAYALQLAETLRDSDFSVVVNTAGGSFKSQFKKADKSGARFAFIMGEEELSQRAVGFKDLRANSEQHTVKLTEIVPYLKKHLSSLG